MTPVFWDIDTLDWKSQNPQKVVKHIYKNVGKHDVILLHDVFGTSVDAALAAIDTLTKQGYTFVTVDELLID
jgi:peptidoglycan/xylan/chitin deacetylase (PgdA/CDA1 family)